ncbi:TetR/AcrR family transcriptional regulator [uncultured Roseibium sp.]|uniref:TetR/AcrR family transcriptional regulator n=1 Tax=uncultured Roseibium sp. TaxID=1936171 RepID=UPI00260D3D95|nr:TetR/AcrR family transcriptional regulator [uncultured Roseibium sp.]
MAAKKTPGRPSKGAGALSKKRIIDAAAPLLQQKGLEAVSFRRLADNLGVSAMAIKYHIGSQQELLSALVEHSFKDTLGTIKGESPAERLRHVLSMYCIRALENPNAIRCILNDASLMSLEIIEITEEIRKYTRLLNDDDPDDVLLNLLVDYTHGFVFSAVAAAPNTCLTQEDYLRSIDWTLSLCKDQKKSTPS